MRWWERVVAWDTDHRLAVDSVTAVGLALLLVPLTTDVLRYDSQAPGAPATVTYVAAAVMAFATAFRRVRPVASAVVVFAAALAHLLAGSLLVVPGDLLVLLALYSVTAHGPVWAYRTAITGTFVGCGVFVVAAMGRGGFNDPVSSAAFGIAMSLMAVTVFAIGLVRRARREAIDALVDRAARLEVERDQQGRIATAAERARIAREMHDIVAHSLSVMIAQADGGRYAAAQDPGAAERALTTIGETGRAALGDMRRLLGVLRADDPGRPAGPPTTPGVLPPPAAPPAQLSPQPGVDDLQGLVDQVRASGVRASLVRLGDARPLPPGTGLTVFRIAQESLTNVLKHGGPDVAVTVVVQWRPSSLTVEITDDGRGAAATSDGAGQGVLGMRERAAMLGGTLAVGPRPGGGYRVRAEIPLPTSAPRALPVGAAGTPTTTAGTAPTSEEDP
ncbi:sensor histidine kinase [Actinotalea sp. AC32]|nr:sensor histidine kinase [Actinotalea sp. AC32]